MLKTLFILFSFTSFLFANSFKIVSYNVENLFDLTYNKTDYKEYRPNSNSNWNKKTFEKKLQNTIRVLKDLDADIIALQEIENRQLLQLLQKRIPEFKYISFGKYKNSSVGVGFLSKVKIVDEKTLNIKFSNKIYRPILETTFLFENKEFKLFNNHWPSKRVAESFRVKYAKKLFDRLQTIPKDYDYILLGDFNSNYNEHETIFHEKKLNNTNGITGINHVLNTFINNNYVTKKDLESVQNISFFNPWLEKSVNERFSSKFRGRSVTPDNILLPFSMFDTKGLSYVENSFEIFKPNYLYKNGKVNRWQMKNRVHTGIGFSDHLPISIKIAVEEAKTKLNEESFNKKISKATKIDYLYNTEKLYDSIELENCVVLLRSGNFAIIKQENSRAILIYSKNNTLSEGFSYNLEIDEIKTYKGLKEITKFNILDYNGKKQDYKKFYHTSSQINIFDLNNQNEIIQNIKGTYKRRYFYFDNKRVSIYFKNSSFIPKDGSTIIIKRAQISYYMDKVQLTVFNKSDIVYVN